MVQPLETPLLNVGTNPINPDYLKYHRSRRKHHS